MEILSESEEKDNTSKPHVNRERIEHETIPVERAYEELEVAINDLLGDFSEQTGALFG